MKLNKMVEHKEKKVREEEINTGGITAKLIESREKWEKLFTKQLVYEAGNMQLQQISPPLNTPVTLLQ